MVLGLFLDLSKNPSAEASTDGLVACFCISFFASDFRRRDEVMEAPLRAFTGFLMKTSGGREAFWETHGQAYVAKIHLLQEKTDDNAQRYNLKRRLEQVLGERSNLCVWRNILVKESGFFY